jgi:hypothetical protein
MLIGNYWVVRRWLPCAVESDSRESLKQARQVHLFLGMPGRTVWAQSRQTNRPSLYAVRVLNSMPAMQWGQRIVNIVSVIVGTMLSPWSKGVLARGLPDDNPIDPPETIGSSFPRSLLTTTHVSDPPLWEWL